MTEVADAESKETESIIVSLQPLIQQARQEGKWLQCTSFHHPEVFMSPDEFDAAIKMGRFIWGPVNWVLRDPTDELARLNSAIERSIKQRDDFFARMSKRNIADEVEMGSGDGWG